MPQELGSRRSSRHYRYGRLPGSLHRAVVLLRVWSWQREQTGLCGAMKYRVFYDPMQSKGGGWEKEMQPMLTAAILKEFEGKGEKCLKPLILSLRERMQVT